MKKPIFMLSPDELAEELLNHFNQEEKGHRIFPTDAFNCYGKIQIHINFPGHGCDTLSLGRAKKVLKELRKGKIKPEDYWTVRYKGDRA